MDYNLIQDAKNKIYNSELIKFVSSEKIENAFSKIHTFNNINDLLEAYGRPDYIMKD